MKSLRNLKISLVGLALLALPFLLWGGGHDMQEQIGGAKLFGCFLLGNLVFAFLVGEKIHPIFGFAHFAYAFDAWLTGFGPGQLYPFCYWSAALCFALWFLKQTEREQRLLLHCVVASAVISGLYALVQMTGHDFIFSYAPDIDSSRPIGFFGQYTRYGSFMGCVGAMALGLELILPWAFIGLMVLATKSCFSIACFLVGSAVAGTQMVPLLKRFALLATILGGTLSALGVFFMQNMHMFYSHGRLEIWRATILAWWQAPLKIFLFGFGPSSFRYLFAPHFQPVSTRDHGIFLEAHNDYLNLLFENGCIGLLFLAAFGVVALLALRKRWWESVWIASRVERGAQAFLVAVLVNAVGNFPFQQAPHYFLAILSAALVFSCAKNACSQGR